MTTINDLQGRPYARLSALKPGDIIIVDDGFTCMLGWSEATIMADEKGDLWFKCDSGRHYLEGQLADEGQLASDDLDSLIGIYNKESFKP